MKRKNFLIKLFISLLLGLVTIVNVDKYSFAKEIDNSIKETSISQLNRMKVIRTLDMTEENLKKVIDEEVKLQLFDIQKSQDYQLQQVILPEGALEKSSFEVELVFEKNGIKVPLVEKVSIEALDLIFEKPANQFTKMDLMTNPSLVIKEIKGTNEKKENFTFKWVNETGNQIDLEQWLAVQNSKDSVYIEMESDTTMSNSFKKNVTHQEIEAYMKEESTESRVMPVVSAEYGLPIIIRSELEQTKTDEERQALVNQALKPVFKNKETDEIYTSYSTDIGILQQDSLSGTLSTITYSIDVGETQPVTTTIQVTVLPEGSIENIDEWEGIEFKSDFYKIEHPINHSGIGFPEPYMGFNNVERTGYQTLAPGGNYSFTQHEKNFVIYEDNSLMYFNGSDHMTSSGWGGYYSHQNPKRNETKHFFLKHKSEDRLKQIIVEEKKSNISVLDISLKTNLNFEMRMSTYNIQEHGRNFSILESSSLRTGSRQFVYENNRGFYSQYMDEQKVTYVLKNKRGEWLSDINRMTVGAAYDQRYDPNFPYQTSMLTKYNRFNSDFSKDGFESANDLVSGNQLANTFMPYYHLGASPKTLKQDEKITVGYEMFYGDDAHILDLEFQPNKFESYSDGIPDILEADYEMTHIPSEPVSGSIYTESLSGDLIKIGTFDSPEGETSTTGHVLIHSKGVLETKNQPDGSVEEIFIPVIAKVESEGLYKGFGSSDEEILLESYAFGATPKGEAVLVNSKWTKKPEELLLNKTVLPGNKAKYEYVENPPINTKQAGLHWVKVKMSDQKADKVKIYEVPVNVVEGELPQEGISIEAQDITVSADDVQKMSDNELDAFLIKESKVVAWDNKTGSTQGIKKQITHKNVFPSSEPGEYEATITATKGDDVSYKIITVTVVPELKITVNQDKIPKDTPLGTAAEVISLNNSEKVLKEWVTVSLQDKEITNYGIELVSFDSNNITNEGKINAELVISLDDYSEKVPLSIPVLWGDSIAIGGAETSLESGESALAITLHDDFTGKYLTLTNGNLPDDKKNNPLDKKIGSKPFLQLTQYQTETWGKGKNNALEVFDGPNPFNEVDFSVDGNQKPIDVLQNFGDNGRLVISYGDAMRLYTDDGYQKVQYKQNQGPLKPVQGLPRDTTAFGVVTKQGFYPTYLAHLDTEGVQIPSEETRSEEKYDTHYQTQTKEYLVVPNGVSEETYQFVETDGFKTYPRLDLAVGEKSTGSVYVAEKTSVNDQYLKYSYGLSFVGTGPELSLSGIPSTIDFGQPSIKSKKQTIQQVKESDKWGFVVEDNRIDEKRNNWEIQMKAEPFKTGVQNDFKPLKGAVLSLKTTTEQVDLNTEFQTVHIRENPKQGINDVLWQGKEGFYLSVPNGYIEADVAYTSSVDVLLSDVPNTSHSEGARK